MYVKNILNENAYNYRIYKMDNKEFNINFVNISKHSYYNYTMYQCTMRSSLDQLMVALLLNIKQ